MNRINQSQPRCKLPTESEEYIFGTVKIKPISINTCWKGQRFKTEKYADWRKESFYLLKNITQKKIQKPCSVHLTFYCSKNFKTADIDNMIKPALDSLVEAGVISDDRIIETLFVDKKKSKKDFWDFLISEK